MQNSSRDEAAKDAGVSPKENGGNAGCGGGGGAGGGDSPTHSAGTPPASHPSRDLLQEILRKPGPYPMVRSAFNPLSIRFQSALNPLPISSINIHQIMGKIFQSAFNPLSNN